MQLQEACSLDPDLLYQDEFEPQQTVLMIFGFQFSLVNFS